MSARSTGAWSSRSIWGLVLLVLAVLALLERSATLTVGQIAPTLLGLGFLVAALLSRQSAFVVPAGILLGLGAGILAERYVTAGVAVDRALFFGCLAAGFASVTVLAQLAFRQRLRWPLIPAALLAIIALAQLAGAEMQQGFRLVRQFWPFLALAAGLWLLFAVRRR